MADWSLIACMDDMHDEEQPTIKNMPGNFKSHALTDGAPGFQESACLSRWSQWVNHFISHSFLIPSVALPMLGKALCVTSCHANSLYLVWLLRQKGVFCKSPLALCYTAWSAFLIFHDTLAKVTCSGLITQQKSQIWLFMIMYSCIHHAVIYTYSTLR